MTPEPGLPDARPFRAAMIGIVGGMALLLGIIVSAPATSGESSPPPDGPTAETSRQENQTKGEEPHPPPVTPALSLDKPISLIEGAFRSGKPDPLTPLLPAEGKTFLSLGSVGYYSRDQVYFILGAIFARRDTIRFTVRPRKPAEPSGNGNRTREGSSLVYCIATWTYHGHDGIDGETQIHFVLLMKKGVWSLVEIREAR